MGHIIKTLKYLATPTYQSYKLFLLKTFSLTMYIVHMSNTIESGPSTHNLHLQGGLSTTPFEKLRMSTKNQIDSKKSF